MTTPKVDVRKLADEIAPRLLSAYNESVRDNFDKLSSADGSLSRTEHMISEIEALRLHLERYTTELVTAVVEELQGVRENNPPMQHPK